MAHPYTTGQFIRKAKEVHGTKYNYNKTEYFKTVVPIEITCNQCSHTFKVLPIYHLRGTGCPKCAKRTMSTEEYLKGVPAINHLLYDYSKTKYSGVNNPIIFLCNTCKTYQTVVARKHALGQGCKNCKIIHNRTRRKNQTRQNKPKSP